MSQARSVLEMRTQIVERVVRVTRQSAMTHKVALSAPDDVDEDLAAVLRGAFEANL